MLPIFVFRVGSFIENKPISILHCQYKLWGVFKIALNVYDHSCQTQVTLYILHALLKSKLKKHKTDYSFKTLKHLHLLQPEHWNKQLHCTKNCVMRYAIQYELFCSHADRTCPPTLIHLALSLFAKSLAYVCKSIWPCECNLNWSLIFVHFFPEKKNGTPKKKVHMLMLLQLGFIFLQVTTLYALLWDKFAMS